MKKFFIYLIIILIALAVAAYLAMDSFIKMGIEKFVPPVTGTSVNISSVKTSLFKGEIEISGLTIGNPSGFTTPTVFKLGQINVKVDPLSVFKKNIVVDQVNIQDAKATFEINRNGTNVSAIQKNINAYLNKNGTNDQPKKTDTPESEKTLTIRDLSITGAQIEIASGLTKTQQSVTLPIPPLHLTNIGQNNRQTISEVLAQILSAFSTQALQSFAASGQELLKQTIGNVQEQMNEVKQNLKETRDQIQADLEQKKTDLKEDGQNLKDSFKNMFKQD